MYTVFVNNKKLLLASASERLQFSRFKFQYNYTGKSDMMKVVDELEKNPQIKNAVLFSEDFDKMWKDFESCFSIIEAAGGLVFNTENKLLVIFRRGKWDLPKGKVEKDENIEEAAMREVEEECGIGNLKIEKQIYSTYHTYMLEGVRVLKETFWFKMKYTGNKTPVPQTEEGITMAKWADKTEMETLILNTYSSIKLLMEEVLE